MPAFAQRSKPTTNPASQFTQLAAQAAAARDAGRLTEAVTLYERAVRLRPTWQEGWWALGQSRYELRQWAEARAAFRRLSALAPKAGAAWAMLGLCEFELGDHPQALVHLQRGRKLGYGSGGQLASVADYHAALLLNRGGQFEAAYELLRGRARAGDENDDLLVALGLSVLRIDSLPAALPDDRRAMARQAGQAAHYAETNRAVDARREYEELRTRYPGAPGVHYASGVFLLRESPDEAMLEFCRELAVSPGHVQARLQLALELLKRQEAESALPLAEETVRLAPRNAAARYALGRVALALGQAARAAGELEAAARLAPDSPEIHFALAQAYARAGRQADAARARAEFSRLERSRSNSIRN